MSEPLLITKLHVPRSRTHLVLRPRLLDRLHAGLGGKLTLVSAPAGSGKTTLVTDLLSSLDSLTPHGKGSPALLSQPRSTSRLRIAWLSLDAADNQPGRFFAYLLAALHSADAQLGESARRLLESTAEPPEEHLVASIINDLAAAQGRVILVLDDYHTLTELRLHEAVGLLLDRLPVQAHLVIVTRHDPPLPLSRLRGRGEMTEIRESDLRFTTEEAASFFRETMALNLEADDVVLLEERTEGWITGLQLAGLSMQGRDRAGRASFISGFSGRYHLLVDYLTDEVLRRQSEPMQRFLLHTSILDRMCGPLCDAVLGDSGAGSGNQVLEQLEAANLFTVALNEERTWFRTHRLFAELLHARLRQTQPHLVPELHHRAARWFEEAGFASEAVQHALASGDASLAADLIERTITKLSTWSRAHAGTMLRWLEALPDEAVRARPWLRLFASRTRYVAGQPRQAAQVLDELDDWLKAHPTAPDAARLSELVAVDRASYAAVLGDVRHAKSWALKTLAAAADGDPIARFRAPAILGMACFRAGEVAQAREAFSQAVDIALEGGLTFAAVPFLCNLAETLLVQGRLREAMRTCRRAAELSRAAEPRHAASGFVGLELAKILYEWNDLEAAHRCLLDGLDLLSRGGISEAFGSAHTILAHLKQALGDAEGARAAAHQAVGIAERDNIPRLIILAQAHQARVWLAQGDLDSARRWAGEYQQVGDTEYLREFEDLTLVRLHLAEGQAETALSLLDRLEAPAVDAGRGATVVEVQALRAMALYALDRGEAAVDTLREALSCAEPEGYVRLFADGAEPMAFLLREAARRGIATHYVGRLLTSFTALRPAGAAPGPQPIAEPLTERELEVLRLLAEGLSNREIGRRLFISLPTVKSHTSHIYGKLGVRNRQSAVAQAGALGILAAR